MPSARWGHSKKLVFCNPEQSFYQNRSFWLSLRLLASRTMRNKFIFFLSHPVYGIFLSSLNELRNLKRFVSHQFQNCTWSILTSDFLGSPYIPSADGYRHVGLTRWEVFPLGVTRILTCLNTGRLVGIGPPGSSAWVSLPEDVDRSRKELESEFTISLLAYYCFYNKLPQI